MTEKIRAVLSSDLIGIISKLLVVCLIPWCVWVTRNQMNTTAFMQKGDRFSQLDGALLELKFDRRLDSLPPQDWRDRIQRIETNVEAMRREHRMFVDEITREFVRKNER